MKKAGKRQIGLLGAKAKSIDIFGEGVSFNIGGQGQTFKTYCGSLLTLSLIVITATYATKRF